MVDKSCWSTLRDLSCVSSNASQQRSAAIDRQLNKDKQVYNAAQNLMLMGISESGKSTIFNQLRILHNNGFSFKEKQRKIHYIKENILDAIIAITRAMPKLSPPVCLEHPENQARVEWIEDLRIDAYIRNFEYPQEFFEQIKALWKDGGIQTAYERNNEYELMDCAKYFLDQIDVIKQPDYTPTKQDILNCYDSTRGIFVTHFQVDKVNFNIFDVGGRDCLRRVRTNYLSNMTGIIFVAAINSYHTIYEEDPCYRNLRESLLYFQDICNNRWFSGLSLILLLNKQDLLTEKIVVNKIKLENFFVEFQAYQTPNADANYTSEPPEVVRAKCFIRHEFVRIATESRQCGSYWYHFTCATDTENIKHVFYDCRKSILNVNLHQHKLK